MDEVDKSDLKEKCLVYRQSIKDDIELLKSLWTNLVESCSYYIDLHLIQKKLEEAYMFMGQHLLFNPITREEKYNYESFLSWFSFQPIPLDYEKYYESFKDVEKDLDSRMEGFNSAVEQNTIRAKKEDRNYESWLDASCLNTGSYPLSGINPGAVKPATAYLPARALVYNTSGEDDIIKLEKIEITNTTGDY